MLSTIKGKLVFGVIVLIFFIQLASGWIQYTLVRTTLFDQFIAGAQYLSHSTFLDLKGRLSGTSQDSSKNETEIFESLYIFLSLIQNQQFESILNAKDDLIEVLFINEKKVPIARSVKGQDQIRHFFKSEELKTDMKFLARINTHQTVASELNGKIFIFVPFDLNGIHLGGIILIFTNESLIAARNSMLLATAGLIALFMILCSIIVILFVRQILAHPIEKMVNLMRSLAHGQLNQTFDFKRNNEIGDMGIALNMLSSSLREVINEISHVMGCVKNGNLTNIITVDLKGDLNKIKDDINQSIYMLNNTITVVLSSSKSVELSARELSNSAEILSTSTAHQASTLEQISSSIVEIEHHSKENATNANQAKKHSTATMELVKKGRTNMQELQDSMDEINVTSSNVNKIIKVIDEIAFQTNLLALNAAVEAARAGKYGKGFAVVAEEVRNLASRSAEAVKDTASLIESSVKNVEKGVAKTEKTGAILSEIVSEVEKTNDIVSMIADASTQQNTGIAEITAAVSDVNRIIQQNSAIAQETASASDVLLSQSNNLQTEISKFQLLNRVVE